MLEMEPDNSIIAGQNPTGAGHIQAIKGKSFAFIYVPTGNVPSIRLGKITGSKIKAWWYNPRNGESSLIGIFNNSGEKTFVVPGMSKEMEWLISGRGCDWVLVLDDTLKGFGQPGK